MAVGITFKIDTKIQGELFKHPEKAMPIFNKEFGKALNDSVLYTQREVVSRTPIRTGILRKSITTDIKGSGLDLQGTIGTPMVYAAPQEYGVTAGQCFPPIARLALWARQLTPYKVRQYDMGYFIARGIYEKGIKAKHMFRDGFKASKGYILKALNDAQARVLKGLE